MLLFGSCLFPATLPSSATAAERWVADVYYFLALRSRSADVLRHVQSCCRVSATVVRAYRGVCVRLNTYVSVVMVLTCVPPAFSRPHYFYPPFLAQPAVAPLYAYSIVAPFRFHCTRFILTHSPNAVARRGIHPGSPPTRTRMNEHLTWHALLANCRACARCYCFTACVFLLVRTRHRAAMYRTILKPTPPPLSFCGRCNISKRHGAALLYLLTPLLSVLFYPSFWLRIYVFLCTHMLYLTNAILYGISTAFTCQRGIAILLVAFCRLWLDLLPFPVCC